MRCSRCLGSMVEDRFLVFEGLCREMWATGWRCVNCGRTHNSVAEENRLAREENALKLHLGVKPSGNKAA